MVSNDVIKGPLKVLTPNTVPLYDAPTPSLPSLSLQVNATVEVRGSDGVYVSGVITRLTDASTYTVGMYLSLYNNGLFINGL